jgi:hypothetical protein
MASNSFNDRSDSSRLIKTRDYRGAVPFPIHHIFGRVTIKENATSSFIFMVKLIELQVFSQWTNQPCYSIDIIFAAWLAQ